MMNYLNAWEKYAKWRYNSESDVVLMPSETASDAVSEAISASGCKLVKIVLGKVLNGVVTVPETTAVPLNYFDDVTFIGDSLTLGMESYKTGLPNAKFCAYKGIGPNAIATDMTCAGRWHIGETAGKACGTKSESGLYFAWHQCIRYRRRL